jgi:hypothetical protein
VGYLGAHTHNNENDGSDPMLASVRDLRTRIGSCPQKQSANLLMVVTMICRSLSALTDGTISSKTGKVFLIAGVQSTSIPRPGG